MVIHEKYAGDTPIEEAIRETTLVHACSPSMHHVVVTSIMDVPRLHASMYIAKQRQIMRLLIAMYVTYHSPFKVTLKNHSLVKFVSMAQHTTFDTLYTSGKDQKWSLIRKR
jgi:hypothetical protein